jgi:hypothetical protein
MDPQLVDRAWREHRSGHWDHHLFLWAALSLAASRTGLRRYRTDKRAASQLALGIAAQ